MSAVMATGVVLSLVTGTVALTLGVLAWRQFAGTPFGRVLLVLPLVYGAFVGYHAFLVVANDAHGTGPAAAVAAGFETLAFAGLAAFTFLTVRLHHRMSRRPEGRRDT